MTLQQHDFESRDALCEALAGRIIDDLVDALARRDRASLLLSGGSTPTPLYRALSGAALDWSRVDVALVDERWVDPGHAASNERLLRETLLTGAADAASLIGMKTAHAHACDGLQSCNEHYASLPWPATLCLLGMGPDGHTASLFPHAHGLDAAFAAHQHCAPIEAIPSAVTGDLVERMTLTPWSILQSERLVLMITGEEKRAVLERALEVEDSRDMPIAHILRKASSLEVYWAP